MWAVQTRRSCLLLGAVDGVVLVELDELVVAEASLLMPFGDFELGVVRSEFESSCFTSRRAARPMLSLVITLLSMSSEPG